MMPSWESMLRAARSKIDYVKFGQMARGAYPSHLLWRCHTKDQYDHLCAMLSQHCDMHESKREDGKIFMFAILPKPLETPIGPLEAFEIPHPLRGKHETESIGFRRLICALSTGENVADPPELNSFRVVYGKHYKEILAKAEAAQNAA